MTPGKPPLRALLACSLLALLVVTTTTPASTPVCLPLAPGERIFLSGFEPAVTYSQPGPFTLTTLSGTSTGSGRDTPWTAVVPQSDQPLPMVLFAPGAQVSSAAYQNWIAHLASWGFVAVRADPPASLFTINHLHMSEDLRAVLDDLLIENALPGSVDPQRIAMAGHSLGGKLAFMVAASDARIAAILVLDPVNGAGPSGYTSERPSIVPGTVAALELPMGILGELTDTASGPFGMACAPASQNYQTIFQAADSSPAAYEWTLNGAGHMDFVTNPDQCGLACAACLASTLPPAETHAFMRSAGVAFLRTHLSAEGRHCEALVGEQLPGSVSLRVSPLP